MQADLGPTQVSLHLYCKCHSPCTGTDTATVTVTEQAAPNAGTDGTLTVCAGNNSKRPELFAQLTDAGGTWTNTGF
jgi:hypothetical protein